MVIVAVDEGQPAGETTPSPPPFDDIGHEDTVEIKTTVPDIDEPGLDAEFDDGDE